MSTAPTSPSLLITSFLPGKCRSWSAAATSTWRCRPLYSIPPGRKVAYARDDAHKDELLRTEFTGRGKVEIGRFKGLGEMMAHQLKETTMDPRKRTLLRVDVLDEEAATKDAVEALMGTKPEARFRFIQERAEFAEADALDI